MSHDILIEDLRAKGEKKIQTFWQQAETEIERVQKEAAQKLASEQEKIDQQHALASREVRRTLVLETQQQAGRLRAAAERKLADRLYNLARVMLGRIRLQDAKAMLEILASELPPSNWSSITVHPDDREQAGQFFPGAEIIPDPDISGGLLVTSPDNRVRIDNTLEKRLERAWPQLLPKLMKELKEIE